LNPDLPPITFRIGFLKSPIATVQEAFLRWRAPHFQSLQAQECQIPLKDALLGLQPLTALPRRWLLVPTSNEWVAYFDNGIRGSDPVSAVGHLSRELSCEGLIATFIPNTLEESTGTKKGLYGAVQFEMFAAHETHFLNYLRTISVTNDGGKWRFDANGVVQHFEETAAYGKRRLTEKFTHEMLIRYCHAIGISVDDPNYYRQPSILISSKDQLPNGGISLSVKQAQLELGIDSM